MLHVESSFSARSLAETIAVDKHKAAVIGNEQPLYAAQTSKVSAAVLSGGPLMFQHRGMSSAKQAVQHVYASQQAAVYYTVLLCWPDKVCILGFSWFGWRVLSAQM